MSEIKPLSLIRDDYPTLGKYNVISNQISMKLRQKIWSACWHSTRVVPGFVLCALRQETAAGNVVREEIEMRRQ